MSQNFLQPTDQNVTNIKGSKGYDIKVSKHEDGCKQPTLISVLQPRNRTEVRVLRTKRNQTAHNLRYMKPFQYLNILLMKGKALYRTKHSPVLISRGIVKQQRLSYRWFKVLAVAIAIGVLPIWTHRTNANDFARPSISQLTIEAQENRFDDTENLLVEPQRQLPITLVLETVVAVLLLVGLLSAFLANRTIRAVKTTQDESWLSDESNSSMQLATPIGLALDKMLVPQQEAEAEQALLYKEVSLRLRQSQTIEELLKTTVKEVRRSLKTDRVIIYGLDQKNWDGTVVAESVAPGWPQTLRVRLDDPCFKNKHVELYKNGQITAINDIYQEPRVTDCYRSTLEQFAVKANLVAPILKNSQLLGLLIAHQCSEPRHWQKGEIDLFTQLASQVGLVMDQVNFIEQQEAETERAQLFTEISLRLRQSQFLEELLKTTVKEVRRALKTDRVIILGLDPTNWHGIVVAESVAAGFPQTLRVRIDDPCLKKSQELYKNGQITKIDDIYHEPRVKECYRRTLEQFAVKANLVAPILKNSQLLGLLIAHQCSEPRHWQKGDIDLFAQLATQVGFAVDEISLIEEIE